MFLIEMSYVICMINDDVLVSSEEDNDDSNKEGEFDEEEDMYDSVYFGC